MGACLNYAKCYKRVRSICVLFETTTNDLCQIKYYRNTRIQVSSLKPVCDIAGLNQNITVGGGM